MLATESTRPCISKDAQGFRLVEQNGECNQMDCRPSDSGWNIATNFIDHNCNKSGDCCRKLDDDDDDGALPQPTGLEKLVGMFEKNRINNHMASKHQPSHLHHGPSFYTYDKPDSEKNVVHQHASIIHHHHHQQNLWATKMMMMRRKKMILSSMDQSGINSGSSTVQQQLRYWRPNNLSCFLNVLPSNNDCYISYLFVLLVIILFTPACFCIKVVSLNVPSHVRRGSDLELSCLFDLGNATLYSLKWFYRAHEWDREEQEFFRFTPRHKPYKQVFPLEGIQVDLSKSSGSVVYIRQANSKTSGKYKCEISVEETFQTVAAEKLMTVFNSSFSRLKDGLLWNNHLMITICLAFIANITFIIIY